METDFLMRNGCTFSGNLWVNLTEMVINLRNLEEKKCLIKLMEIMELEQKCTNRDVSRSEVLKKNFTLEL